jgi:hypothetical protein
LLQLKMSAVLPAEVAIEEAVSEGDSQ